MTKETQPVRHVIIVHCEKAPGFSLEVGVSVYMNDR